MRTQSIWMVTLLMAFTCPGMSAGAQVAELQVGTRVRIRAPSTVAGRLTGVVVARSADSVSVSRVDALPITIPVSSLTSLEISRGKNRGRGAGKGALWGGGVMLLMGAGFSDRPCKTAQSGATCERVSAAESALLAGASGAMIGAVIGAAVGSERWVRAALPGRLALTAAPSVQGLRVSLRFTPARP